MTEEFSRNGKLPNSSLREGFFSRRSNLFCQEPLAEKIASSYLLAMTTLVIYSVNGSVVENRVLLSEAKSIEIGLSPEYSGRSSRDDEVNLKAYSIFCFPQIAQKRPQIYCDLMIDNSLAIFDFVLYVL